jgi:hypothetical protein
MNSMNALLKMWKFRNLTQAFASNLGKQHPAQLLLNFLPAFYRDLDHHLLIPQIWVLAKFNYFVGAITNSERSNRPSFTYDVATNKRNSFVVGAAISSC